MKLEDAIIELGKIYNWLSDEQSKEIYINRINFLITGNYEYMYHIIKKYVPDMAELNDKAIPQLLKSLPMEKKIILYGAGEDAKANLHYFANDTRFIGFCDGNVEKQKSGVQGYTCISPEKLLQDENCSIVISTHRGLDEIKHWLIAKGVNSNRIYEMTPYMFAMQEEQYFNTDFLQYAEEEVFVDAGCCDLGTSIKLSKHCRKLRKVYAFEPDLDNYHVCMKKKDYFDDGVVELFQKGTWSERKTLYFNATADGSSHIVEQGEVSIEVMTIDEAVDSKEKVTFIKMDVEGSELESLKGAQNTIKKDKPKLAICIYHKPEDMITIPLYIKSLVPEYRLFLRHHSNGAGETVLYAVI